MRYSLFRQKYQDLPLIVTKDITMSNKQILFNQLKRWQGKGLVIKLKRGVYLLNKDDCKVNPSRQYIAKELYAPSYISLEYALSFYGLIPERIPQVTSVTTKKTTEFQNELGVFSYQRIKPQVFRAYRMVKDENGLEYFMAEPEKAVLDFIYLNLRKFDIMDKDIFKESYRFQNTETLNGYRMMELSKLYKSEKLTQLALFVK